MNTSNKLRFGLLGAGRIGKIHARTIAENCDAELVAIADPNADTANLIAARHECDIRTVDEIENANDIDAVIICTPTNTHADLIERFALAGKAIFCEKPIDLDVARVRDCLSVVQKANATLMVGFNRRFDPHLMAMRQTIIDGKIGDVEMVHIVARDPGLPSMDYLKSSGGIFRDMTIHDFDIARFMLNEAPMYITASASVLVDKRLTEIGDYDSISINMMTASGQHCHISNSRRATFGHDQRVEVFGSKGMVSTKNQREADIEIATADGFTRPPILDFFMTRYAQSYVNEMTAFIETVKTEQPASPSGIDGLIALAMAQAAMMSVELGSRVHLNEILT